jgi:hypothetical protein
MEPRAQSPLVRALLVLANGVVLAGCGAPGTAELPVRAAMLDRFCPEAGKVRRALAAFPSATSAATPADWRELRRPAIAMLDAAEALPKTVTDLPGYPGQVAAVRAAGRVLVEAVDRRDAAGLPGAGTRLLQACAGCHAAGGAVPSLAAATAPATP